MLLLLVYGGFVWIVVAALRARAGSDPPERGAVAEALAVATVLFVPLHLLEPYFVTDGLPHLWWALLGLAMARTRPPLGAVGRRILGAMSPVVVCGRPQNLARAREFAAALGGEATSAPWRRPLSRGRGS